MNKRTFLLIALAGAMTLPLSASETNERNWLTVKLEALMRKWHIPGGSVSILRDGRLVYARGLGVVDEGSTRPVRAGSLFRIASLSKPITATAVLLLVEQGRLGLDAPMLDYLPQYRNVITDIRVKNITVRHLLQHSGGWDSALSGDPMSARWEDYLEAGLSLPPKQEEVIAAWLTLPLDFEPGSKFAYSNFGYVLLGRIIESVTRTPYGRWTAENILEPAGMRFTKLAGSLLSERVPGEVEYSDSPGSESVLSVFSRHPELVARPYGGFSLPLQDSAGGWLSSSIELAKFIWQLAEGKLLKKETLTLLAERPAHEDADSQAWYGLGMNIVKTPAGVIWEHAGAFPGTVAEILHFPGSITYAAVFNSKPEAHLQFVAELQMILLDIEE